MKYSVWMKKYYINHSFMPKGVKLPWHKIGTFECPTFAYDFANLSAGIYEEADTVYAVVNTKGVCDAMCSFNKDLLEYAHIDGFDKNEEKEIFKNDSNI